LTGWEHQFLGKALETFGFGENIERSIRQGCPLSALLYSITVEPLATLIKADKDLKPIHFADEGVRLVHQYADDTTFTVEDIESINRIVEHIQTFGRAAGAKINIEKSEIMSFGEAKISDCDIPFKNVKDYIRVLGVNLGVEDIKARDITWSVILQKIRQTVNYWKLRGLTLKGKVTVINVLLISRFIHALSVLDMPEWVLKEANSIIVDFLWNGKNVRISKKVLIADKKEGGLNLMDLNVRREALRLKVVKKYLYNKETYGWKHCMRDCLEKFGALSESNLFVFKGVYDKRCTTIL